MHNDIPLFTIDEPHSRDLDDAIGVARSKTGWIVRVAIANPSAAVAMGSAEDQAARQQGATVYRGRQATQPMLPRPISELQATLTAGELRSAMLIDLELDLAGRLSGAHLSLGEITVAQRLAYRDVPAIAGDQVHELHLPMVDAIAIARGFLKQRRARGALAIFDQQQSLLTDEEGRIRYYDASEMVGHILVQEMMIAANAAVAELAARKDVPFLYRCHEPRISAPRGTAAPESLEAWIAGGHASSAAAAERLNLIAQKARYMSTLTGHYGLNVPAYAHITSPLRRYADLVAQRQLVALIQGTALPYSQDDLTEIGNDLFEASEANVEATSEFFKAPVLSKALAAIESNAQHALRGLADNELGQAVKVGLAGTFAPALVDELLRRMAAGTLADKVSVRFIEGRGFLPQALADGFIAMVSAKPASAMSFVNHARAINAIAAFDVQFAEVSVPGAAGPSFRATATMRDAERGATYTAVATDVRKKSAEQAAALQTLCDFMNVARPVVRAVNTEATSPSPATISAAVGSPQLPNAKGALLEFCQKNKLGTPTFISSSTGPSNAPSFVCVVDLAVNGGRASARSRESSTKRQAEALAAQALLEQLVRAASNENPDSAPTSPVGGAGEVPASDQAAHAGSVPEVVNPGRAIQLLQEYAQKARLAPPVYEFVEISKTPSSFECRVHLARPGDSIEFRAGGASKQASKSAAAVGALDLLAAIAT
ncbi:RNB domain-containing ribonuclease [Variovorax sp. LjRoot175]|uniref:RNB domain-containing ribonuclease n=1 Tax=Variovorax sp. LjRoot175 TaxID=3342276 RepID=UPI003ECDFBDE